MRAPTPAAPLSDRQRLTRATQPTLASPGLLTDRARQLRPPAWPRPPAPPAAMRYNTLVINGKNGSR